MHCIPYLRRIQCYCFNRNTSLLKCFNMFFHEIEFGFLFPSSLKLCTSNLWSQPNVKETISQELGGFSFCNSSFFFPFTGVICPLTMSLVLAHAHSLTMAELGLRADDSTSSHCFCSAGFALVLQNLLLDCISPHLSRSVLVLSGPSHLQSSKPGSLQFWVSSPGQGAETDSYFEFP